MQTNILPKYDMSDNPTGCCPRFNLVPWEHQHIHLESKRFMRAETRSALHIPLNMGSVFAESQAAIEKAGAFNAEGYTVLSRDLSPWKAEHLFAVSKDVPDHQMVTLSGDFVTKVFEGPFRGAKNWYHAMLGLAKTENRAPEEVYFFYTTCPKCAKVYGKNYVVGFVKLGAAA